MRKGTIVKHTDVKERDAGIRREEGCKCSNGVICYDQVTKTISHRNAQTALVWH